MTGEGGEGGEGEENCHPLITSLLNEGAVIKKDDWTKTRCARPSLTGVGHRDLGWTLLGQGVFGRRS